MQRNSGKTFKAIVIGVSTGGVTALKKLLGGLPTDFPLPILVVSHISPDSDDGLAVLLDTLCSIHVKEANEGELIMPGTVYLAPANYHLLLERDSTIAFSIDSPVNFARPSVDVLFESAADVYNKTLIGILLTGAGNDGSKGMLKIKNRGGTVIVQDPVDAEMDSMPKSALQLLKADYVVCLKNIPELLHNIVEGKL
ncbi:MAG: chemotaxis protein CheB [Desulfuromonadaceae bacterium]|nr:chemotaxis protein CheB [Desulfuromonadaceae bacterium]MDD2855559.1 chemotaxis protein CheB [Desulfuromonadaceae bacterium]